MLLFCTVMPFLVLLFVVYCFLCVGGGFFMWFGLFFFLSFFVGRGQDC